MAPRRTGRFGGCGIIAPGHAGEVETALVSSRVRAAGTTVGPFRLERALGGGHDTEVWRANGDGIIVALKLLRPGADALARARLAREAAVLTSVDHSAIGWLLDAGEEDGEPYLAFTLYEAGTLAARIDRGRLSPEETAAVFAPIADALAYVHGRGIVHRDVKPANVLCAADGPVLVDFSIASITGSTYDGWIDGAPAVAGTEGYRAPEAGLGTPDAAEDVYALGKSMLEAASGALDVGVVVEGALGAVIDGCCSLDPGARPSAAMVAAALRSIAGSVAPVFEPAPAHDVVVEATTPVTERFATRAEELAQLVGAVEDGVAGDELRAVLVVAPAGAGKTWLIDHAVSRVASSRGGSRRVLAARCSEAVGDASVLRPWLRPLLDRGSDPIASLAAVVGRAPATQVARALGIVRGGAVDGDTGVVADALASLLASMGVVVGVVEDLHHASLELLDLLARLSQRSGVPGALWCTTRPGFVDADDLDFETLALSPLDDDAISAVVVDAIGGDATVVVEQVLAVAGGNPLHAREAALAVARGDGESLSSFGSLPELIADRFSHLDVGAREALEIAAACGDAFWPEAVGGGLLAATPALYQSGVAQVRMTSTIIGSTEAGWSHPLLQEVAYSSMDVARRRELHASLGLVLEGVGAGAEVVARQAGTAFRLGDVGSAALAGRAAAGAARDALDRFALSGAASWIELLRDSGHEPAVGTADVLDAELRIARGDFDAAARLVRPLTGRADDVGARALVLATEATAGAGDLRAAERFGESAHERLGDDPQLAASFGAVLARRGRLEDALRLLDAAAENAREAGDDAFAARLAAQAADVAADLAERRNTPLTDATHRTRSALASLQAAGDEHRLAQSIDALFGILIVDSPHDALGMAMRSAQIAERIGDAALHARLAFRVCDAALDLGEPAILREWLPIMRASAISGAEREEANLLEALAKCAEVPSDPQAASTLRAIRTQMLSAIGTTTPEADIAPVSALLWQGRAREARELLNSAEIRGVPPYVLAMFELHLRAVEGPPWTLDDLPPATGTSAHNERALLHLLRHEQAAADDLLDERSADRIADAGHAFQRFTPHFPGALVAALGTSATQEQLRWLTGMISDPAFPGLWVIHRAIAAMLLSERLPAEGSGLRDDALHLLDQVPADAPVRAWIASRLESAAR